MGEKGGQGFKEVCGGAECPKATVVLDEVGEGADGRVKCGNEDAVKVNGKARWGVGKGLRRTGRAKIVGVSLGGVRDGWWGVWSGEQREGRKGRDKVGKKGVDYGRRGRWGRAGWRHKRCRGEG